MGSRCRQLKDGEAQQIREQNGRENGEEGTKVFPTELPHGATAREGFMRSDFLESEGDNNTYTGLFSILGPLPCFFKGMVCSGL